MKPLQDLQGRGIKNVTSKLPHKESVGGEKPKKN
jgi:hypothetical protein